MIQSVKSTIYCLYGSLKSISLLHIEVASVLLALFMTSSVYGAGKELDQDTNKILTPIILQLQWQHQFEFAGFYAAIQQGYYNDIGLSVTVNEFKTGTDIVDEVVSGRAQYGVNDSSLIIDRYKGSPVVLLSNIFQHSPMVLLTKSKSGIISPAQMAGKSIMLAAHETSNASIIAMLGRESVSLDQLNVIEHSFNLEDFISGKVDIVSAYATNEPGTLKQKNIPVNIIHPINYGIDFYGNNIFTNEREITQHPQRARQFVEASLKGWAYALAHTDEIIDLILEKYSQKKSRSSLEFEADALRHYIIPDHIKLGTIDKSRIERIVDVYRKLGILTGDFSLDDFIYDGFTEESTRQSFSEEELEWIRQHPRITLGVDPNWAPFEFIGKNNQYSGMAADYMRLIGKKTGLKIDVQDNATWSDVIDSAKKRQLDVLPAVMKSPQRDKYLDFTKPHINYPMVILTNKDSTFISRLDDLDGKKVVVVKGYVTEDILRNNHPGLILETARDINDAIDMVSNGEAYAFIDNLASITKAISTRGITNLRISGTTNYQFALSLAVPKGNNILLGILQKTLDSLTEKEINEIKNRWISVDYKTSVDYTVIIKVIVAAIILILFVLFWNRRLSIEIKNRKLAEETISKTSRHLADAQNMAHIGSWELDMATNKLSWSDEVYRIFGIDPHKLISYEIFSSVIHPDDREWVDTTYIESVKNKTPYNIEHRLRMPDGTIKHVQERCETFYDNKGDPISSIGTVQDITEQIRMEETLRRSQKMDAMGKLTGGIAHDYNNMLAVMLGFLEILDKKLTDQPELADYVDKIRHAGERGAKLTKKLLAFSRQKSADATYVNINLLLQDDKHMLEKTLTARIQLVLDLAGDLWPVWVDQGDMEDAIVNLSINAMHAIDGSGQLIIKTMNEHLEETNADVLGMNAGDYVALSFTDTGHGIDNAIIDNIFEPFYTTKGEKGTGLGLSQVYGFLERSEGAIKVYSEPGEGTQFVLYFPRYYKDGREDESTDIKSSASLRGSETILVVDDEADLINIITEILSPLGYTILSAESGQQALEILRKEPVDLLLSDVIMPEMNGYDLAKIVQEKYPAIKIQLASGFSDNHENMTNDSLHQNMLHKPYKSQDLLKRIRGLLDKKQ